ncbi:MAG: MerR family transcriptional regulator [Thiolinea sp.]
MVKQATMQADALFPIGTVSEQTGVHSVTLRAWERRYGLLRPSRTPKGHRLYSQQDINRVKQVQRLLEQGVSVGRAQELLSKYAAEGKLDSAEQIKLVAGEDPWKQYANLCRRYIYKLDAKALEKVIDEAISSYSLEIVAHKLLLPLCTDLYGQCCLLTSTKADHAFWYQFLSAKLGAYYLNTHMQSRNNGFRVIVIGVTCQMVYLQTLMLACTLGMQGFQVSLLGADCRPEHLPLVLERSRFDAVIYCNPNEEVLAGLEVLSRITQTELLVQYLDSEKQLHLPAAIKLLPVAFNEASLQLESLLMAHNKSSATDR